MNAKLIIPVMAVGFALGACAQQPVVTQTSCNQDLYQDVIGRNIGEVTFAPTVTKRVITEGSPVTMDHNPQRLNVLVDDKGWIKRVYCG